MTGFIGNHVGLMILRLEGVEDEQVTLLLAVIQIRVNVDGARNKRIRLGLFHIFILFRGFVVFRLCIGMQQTERWWNDPNFSTP